MSIASFLRFVNRVILELFKLIFSVILILLLITLFWAAYNHKNPWQLYQNFLGSKVSLNVENFEAKIINPIDKSEFEKTLEYGELDCENSANNEIAGKMLAMINEDRRKNKLPEFKWNKKLCESAKEKATDMSKNSYFAHVSPSNIDPYYFIGKAGYKYSYAGENLAMNAYVAESAHTGFMNSPGHRENILNENYEEIGIAYSWGKVDGNDAFFIVEHFGSQNQGEASATSKTKIICQDKDKAEKRIKELKKEKTKISEYLDDADEIKDNLEETNKDTEEINDYISDMKKKQKQIDKYIKELEEYLSKCDN